jgi:LysR family hydrogen peroxide-inducible transcriptional activator
MDLRQLNAIVAVAENGSFSAAADALNTVQSNVSSHIGRLERELGATLFDRSAARLTEEGELVVDRARRINAEVQALLADVAAVRHEVSGTVQLGMIGTTARWLVPRLLDTMRDRHPAVRMVIVDATSTSLEPRLLNGSLDLAVVTVPLPSRDLTTTPLFDEDLLLFVPDDHRLAGRTRVRVPDLATIELLLTPMGTAFRHQLETVAADHGVTLHAQAELDGVRLIATLAIEGLGAAILPASAVPARLQNRTRPVRVEGLPRRRVGIAQRRRGLPSAPARATLAVLHELVAAETDGRHGIHSPS